MAKIILVSEKTAREGRTFIGDYIDCVDDHVQVTGNLNDIITVDLTEAEVKAAIESMLPERKVAFRLQVPSGNWTFDEPENKEVWNDNGTWREIADRPKYNVNFDKTTLASVTGTKENMVTELKTCLSLNVNSAKNQTSVNIYDSKAAK